MLIGIIWGRLLREDGRGNGGAPDRGKGRRIPLHHHAGRDVRMDGSAQIAKKVRAHTIHDKKVSPFL